MTTAAWERFARHSEHLDRLWSELRALEADGADVLDERYQQTFERLLIGAEHLSRLHDRLPAALR
jgi:hypothetical protein